MVFEDTEKENKENGFLEKLQEGFVIPKYDPNNPDKELTLEQKKTVIFIDIDDTLRVRDRSYTQLQENKGFYYKQIPLDAIKALYELQDQGYELCLCTGRSHASAKEMGLLDLEYDGKNIKFSGVYANGQEIYSKDEKKITADYMNNEQIKAVLQVCDESKYGCILSTDKGFYIINEDKMSEESKEYLEKIREDGTVINKLDWNDFKNSNINVFNFSIACNVDKEAQKPDWERKWSQIGNLEFDVNQSDKKPDKANRYFDITIKGIDKGIGVDEMKKSLGADYSIAVGDALNDEPMFEHADFKFVMGNAIDKVKEKADLVTTNIHEKAMSGIAFLKNEVLDRAREHFQNLMDFPQVYEHDREKIENDILDFRDYHEEIFREPEITR